MPRNELDPLPQTLLSETPTVKLLYVWLARRGSVDLSQREIAAALGITQSNVSIAIRRLRELGLVEYPSRGARWPRCGSLGQQRNDNLDEAVLALRGRVPYEAGSRTLRIDAVQLAQSCSTQFRPTPK